MRMEQYTIGESEKRFAQRLRNNIALYKKE